MEDIKIWGLCHHAITSLQQLAQRGPAMLQFVAESISCLLLRQLQSPLCCYECRELKLIYLFIFKPFSRFSPPASLNLVQCSAEAEEGGKKYPKPHGVLWKLHLIPRSKGCPDGRYLVSKLFTWLGTLQHLCTVHVCKQPPLPKEIPFSRAWLCSCSGHIVKRGTEVHTVHGCNRSCMVYTTEGNFYSQQLLRHQWARSYTSVWNHFDDPCPLLSAPLPELLEGKGRHFTARSWDLAQTLHHWPSQVRCWTLCWYCLRCT